jgi:HK97 family phage major capsid protein
VDASITGANLVETSNTLAALIEISLEVLEDARVTLAHAVLKAFVGGLAKSLDYACFQGNGADDQTNGLTTGIFANGSITKQNAGAGGASVGALSRGDFINTVGQVATAALQRPCRWYINPGFIPKLMTLKDGPGDTYLLKSPAETGGEWYLVGFPVTWAAQAPGTDGAAQQIAAFGEPQSYLVAMREEFELASSDALNFHRAIKNFRAITRVKAEARDATGFAILKTAAI